MANYIQRNGGYYNIRKLTGLSFEMKILPKEYYTKDEAVKMYKNICLEKGYFPTVKEALTVMPTKLIGYIQRNIGFDKLRVALRMFSTSLTDQYIKCQGI